MQARAILEATAELTREGTSVLPEIMIPLVGTVTEFVDQEQIIRATAKDVFEETGIEFDYLVGTMIELPRACLTADEIAEHAEFFSFGTNDLTQTTFGISRDDAERGFLIEYMEDKILPENPFANIDEEGVGKLMEMGVKLGRQTRPGMEVGICGEHGGDPKSIFFCHKIGLNLRKLFSLSCPDRPSGKQPTQHWKS